MPINHLSAQAFIEIGGQRYPVQLHAYMAASTVQDEPVIQEYIGHVNCRCVFGSYTLSRRRPRNTRIQKVQAKRKALDLSQDGKCCGLRTRKASYALRQAEQAHMVGRRSETPLASEFEYIPARVRRKQAKDARQFWRSWGPTNDPNYFNLSDYLVNEGFDEYLMRKSAEAYGLCAGEIEENYNR